MFYVFSGKGQLWQEIYMYVIDFIFFQANIEDASVASKKWFFSSFVFLALWLGMWPLGSFQFNWLHFFGGDVDDEDDETGWQDYFSLFDIFSLCTTSVRSTLGVQKSHNHTFTVLDISASDLLIRIMQFIYSITVTAQGVVSNKFLIWDSV